MNEKWIAELEKYAKVKTPVGATYAVALALERIAMQLEAIAAAAERPKGPMLYGEEPRGKK
jgi:hypothetical protein